MSSDAPAMLRNDVEGYRAILSYVLAMPIDIEQYRMIPSDIEQH